jgi:hypothetical protein
MVSVSIKNDLLELRAFLEGHEYLNGHPNDTELKALVEALKNLADNTAGARALAAIKTALRVEDEAGWLVGVLLEHQDDDKFKDAMALCDRISDDLKHVTADCGDVAADYVVNWKGLPPMALGVNPTDETFLELDAYSVVGVDLSGYIYFLERELRGEKELSGEPTSRAKVLQAEVDKLKKTIAKLPTANQLLKFQVDFEARMITWFYNDSYDKVSVEKAFNRFSRIKMLDLLSKMEIQLKQCYRKCNPQIKQEDLDQHELLYEACLAACLKWNELAKAKLNVNLSNALKALKAREEGSKPPRPKTSAGTAPDPNRGLHALLQRLAALR